MRLRVHRTDGGTGTYRQADRRRAVMLALRLDPERMFRSGSIVIGVLNPFTVLNPDDVCWVAADGHPGLKVRMPAGVEHVRRLPSRAEYERILDRQWPKWRRNARAKPGEFLEALGELSFRGGSALYLHVVGRVTRAPLVDRVFGTPAICATYPPDGVIYVNPRTIVRARVYHSVPVVTYPERLWIAEAEEI